MGSLVCPSGGEKTAGQFANPQRSGCLAELRKGGLHAGGLRLSEQDQLLARNQGWLRLRNDIGTSEFGQSDEIVSDLFERTLRQGGE